MIRVPPDVVRAADNAARQMPGAREEIWAKTIRHYLSLSDQYRITRVPGDVFAECDARLDPGLKTLQSVSLGNERF
jgi:hypothetical protein